MSSLIGPKNLFKRVFTCKQTRCTILSDKRSAIMAAIRSIQFHRARLERYIQKHPKFLYSLQPIEVHEGPAIVKLMAEAAEKANVGPMAAVAGVLTDLAVKGMVSEGAEVAVVENGGEAYAVSNKPIDVVLLAGNSPLSKRVGFRLESFPVGIATSSGTVSHALSLGEAEAVTVFAANAGLADAAATAVGNLVKGSDYREAIERGITRALSIKGVRGVFVVYRGMVGKGGRVPRIIKVSTAGGAARDS